MTLSNHKRLVLAHQKEDIEAIINATDSSYPFGGREIKKLLQNVINLKFDETDITIDELKSFLIEESRLQKITFQTPKSESLYIWGMVDEYKLLGALRPNGYYSHLTAMRLHNLVDYDLQDIYFNNEQKARFTIGNLEQSRINNAFKKKQRITTAQTNYGGKVYWLLNGKQTGNYGVIPMKAPNGTEVLTTNLERTLIDITVRPAYAGGVNSVLQAYKVSQPYISIPELSNLSLEMAEAAQGVR